MAPGAALWSRVVGIRSGTGPSLAPRAFLRGGNGHHGAGVAVIGEYREWSDQIAHTIAQQERRIGRLEREVAELRAERDRLTRRATAGACAGGGFAAALGVLVWWQRWRRRR